MLQKDYEMTYLTKPLKPEYLGTVGLCEYVLGDGRNIVWLSLTGFHFCRACLWVSETILVRCMCVRPYVSASVRACVRPDLSGPKLVQ